jgi:aquaglyceroporin related protein
MQVTLSMAAFGRFPWRKVPGYVLGQILGAWLGAIIVFANYFHAIDIFEGKKGRRTLSTGSLFGTYAVSLAQPLHNFVSRIL